MKNDRLPYGQRDGLAAGIDEEVVETWGMKLWDYHMNNTDTEGWLSDPHFAAGFVSVKDDNGRNLLHAAAEMGCADAVSTILEIEPSLANIVTDPIAEGVKTTYRNRAHDRTALICIAAESPPRDDQAKQDFLKILWDLTVCMTPDAICHQTKHNGNNALHYLGMGSKSRIMRDYLIFLATEENSPLYHDHINQVTAAHGDDFEALSPDNDNAAAWEWIQENFLNVQNKKKQTPHKTNKNNTIM